MRLAFGTFRVAAVTWIAIAGGSAAAQPADAPDPAATTETTPPPATTPESSSELAPEPDEDPEKAVRYGVGLRLRNVRIPRAEIELFVDRAPGGASNVGIGAELIRRRGNVELQLGFEYETITPKQGVWIKSGESVPSAEADFILEPDAAGESLGWFTIEFTFLNHAPINDKVAIRYGGGAGLGIITGNLYRYDVRCSPDATNANPEPGCRPAALGGTGGAGGDPPSTSPRKYELPPVFPVVNAIVGVQFKPIPNMAINIEGGIRTLLFFGTSIAYMF